MIMSKLEHIALETVHVFILDANKIQYLGDCVIKGGNRFNKKLTIELPDENRSIDIFDGSYLTRQSFLEKADLVTTMECTKHYFDRGQAARVGIEL